HAGGEHRSADATTSLTTYEGSETTYTTTGDLTRRCPSPNVSPAHGHCCLPRSTSMDSTFDGSSSPMPGGRNCGPCGVVSHIGRQYCRGRLIASVSACLAWNRGLRLHDLGHDHSQARTRPPE